MRPGKRKLAVIGVALTAPAIAGVVIAAWTTDGSGASHAKAGTAQPLSTIDAAASTPGSLYPGATGDLLVKVSNPNPYPIRVTGVSLDGENGDITADGDHAGCTTTGVSFEGASGLSLEVPAKSAGIAGTAQHTLEDAVSMSTASLHACQGATFTIPITLAAESIAPCDAAAAIVSASADTMVNQWDPTTNYGSDGDLIVLSSDMSSIRSLVRFDLPAPPPGCALASATLRLSAASEGYDAALAVHRAAGGWSESTVTWTDQPGIAGTVVTAPVTSGWMEWDVSAHVGEMYAGANDGFVVKTTTEGSPELAGVSFHSRESSVAAQRPQLVVAFAPSG